MYRVERLVVDRFVIDLWLVDCWVVDGLRFCGSVLRC